MSLIEVMVGFLILAIVSVGFYSVLYAGTRSSRDARSVVHISEEARLGLNRMIRDVREARTISPNVAPTASSFRIEVDFDGDGTISDQNGNGDYEDLVYWYHAATQTIRLKPSHVAGDGEVLVAGVTPIPGRDMFSYTSNKLQFDTNPQDGTVTPAELQAAADNNALILSPIWRNYTEIRFAFNVSEGGRTTAFTSEAQLRNNR